MFRNICVLIVIALLWSTATSAKMPSWGKGQQLVRVVTADWNANNGELQRFERSASGWRAVGSPVQVSIGRNGSAWGLGLHPQQAGVQKAEGDGRSPAGIFKIGSAFGYAPTLTSKLEYLALQSEHYCVDVAHSPLYNRIVDTRKVSAAAIEGSTEPMRRDLHVQGDQLYRLGFVIEHNPEQIVGGGSCIFAHLWRGPTATTAGCTAMDEAAMQTLLDWLDKKRRPRMLLAPRGVYSEHQLEWDLPRLP